MRHSLRNVNKRNTTPACASRSAIRGCALPVAAKIALVSAGASAARSQLVGKLDKWLTVLAPKTCGTTGGESASKIRVGVSQHAQPILHAVVDLD